MYRYQFLKEVGTFLVFILEKIGFMVSITTKELEIENDLKKKIEFVCDCYNTKPTIINGNIRNIDKSNLSYVDHHRIIIKGITFFAFNYSKTLYVDNLSNKLELMALENFIKQLLLSKVP